MGGFQNPLVHTDFNMFVDEWMSVNEIPDTFRSIPCIWVCITIGTLQFMQTQTLSLTLNVTKNWTVLSKTSVHQPIELTKTGFAEWTEFSDIHLQLSGFDSEISCVPAKHRTILTQVTYIPMVFFKLTLIRVTIHLSDSLNSLDVLLNAKVRSSFMFIHTSIHTKYFSVDEANCSIQKKCKSYLKRFIVRDNLTAAKWPQLTFQIRHSEHEENERVASSNFQNLFRKLFPWESPDSLR